MASSIPSSGDVIAGRFVVEKVLGSGGMGIVLAARHRELGERVAIKMLRVVTGDPRVAFERLRREARAAARLRGEHVVRVMDVGVLDDGAPYIIMDYVAGQTVARARETAGRLPVAEAVDWVLQACEGLAEAHALGIVHRDIKPSNLLLTLRPDGTPLVKVLDFGVAKLQAAAAATLTETGGFLGSPLYASPEQVRDTRHVDHRTDVWSLGVVLYELVTGSLPFPAFTASAALASLVADPPVPPTSVVPELPPAFEQVLLRCLEKRPDARYGSVGELARDLEPFGSASALGSSARIARILRAEGRQPISDAPPAAPCESPPKTKVSRDETLGPSSTTTKTGRAASSGRPRVPHVVGVVVGIPLLLAAGTLWSRRAQSPDPSSAAATSTRPQVAAGPQTSAVPAVVPVATSRESAAGDEPVAAAPQASSAAATSAAPPHRTIAQPVPRASVSATLPAAATVDFGPRK